MLFRSLFLCLCFSVDSFIFFVNATKLVTSLKLLAITKQAAELLKTCCKVGIQIVPRSAEQIYLHFFSFLLLQYYPAITEFRVGEKLSVIARMSSSLISV